MFLGRECLYVSGVLILVAAGKEMPLDHLVLGSRRACAAGYMGL